MENSIDELRVKGNTRESKEKKMGKKHSREKKRESLRDKCVVDFNVDIHMYIFYLRIEYASDFDKRKFNDLCRYVDNDVTSCNTIMEWKIKFLLANVDTEIDITNTINIVYVLSFVYIHQFIVLNKVMSGKGK